MQLAPFFNQAIKLMVIPFQKEDRFVHFCCIYGATKVHKLFHNNVKGYRSNDIIVSTLNFRVWRSVKFRINLWGHRFSQNANQKFEILNLTDLKSTHYYIISFVTFHVVMK